MASIDDRFGAALLTRKSEIAGKAEESTTLYPLEVMGKYQRLKQVSVRIQLPIYRIENGRTRTLQKEYLATHPECPVDLFTRDTESLETQRAQHEILKKLAKDEDLFNTFQSGTQQTEPVIVTSAGIVVNGNRRLCVWRELYYNNPTKYKHFEFIDLAVLPSDCDEKEIKALEKRLQIQKTLRAEYKWHTKAAMMKEEKESGVPVEELAKSYEMNKKEIEAFIGALDYAEIYLRKIDKKDQWSLVDADEYAFKAIVNERKKLQDQGKKELFEEICFNLIEKGDYPERLYSAIPNIADNIDAIANKLQGKYYFVKEKSNDNSSSTRGWLFDDDINLLGGEDTEKETYSNIASAIQRSNEKLGDLIKQTIDEQKSIKSEQKNSKFLLNALSKASSLLQTAFSNGLNENTDIEGISLQLSTIKGYIGKIEKWITDHQNN